MSNADAVLDGIAANVPLNRLTFEAITWLEHPELFETIGPTSRRTGTSPPWPIEPHNWPVIPEDWWKPYKLGSDDAVMPTIASFAEDLAASNCQPGMIVRNVRCEFQTCAQAMADVTDAVRSRRCSGTGRMVYLAEGTRCSTCDQLVNSKRDEFSDLVALAHSAP